MSELLVVVVVISLTAAATVAVSLPLLARERATSAVHEVRTLMQLARMEAAKRNRACRFEISTLSGRLEVLDTMGTPNRDDDERLQGVTMPSGVSFESPVTGDAAVTLDPVGPPAQRRFHSIFLPDGTVSQGAGNVALFGGDRYRRVSLQVAGGVQITAWDGSAWTAGH